MTKKIKKYFLCIIQFFFRKSYRLRDNVKKYGTAGQATHDNITLAHALFMLNNKGYRHTLRICNTFCFSTAKMVTRTPVNITFICTLSCSFGHVIFTCYFSSLSNFRYSCYILQRLAATVMSHYYLAGTNATRRARTPGA